MIKKIAVILRMSPLNTQRLSEALRMGVGLTLCDDKPVVIFMEDATYALLHKSPLYQKHLETLMMLKCPLLAEREALEERGLKDLKFPVQVMSREQIADVLSECDVHISC